jgi:hypothetical protein
MYCVKTKKTKKTKKIVGLNQWFFHANPVLKHDKHGIHGKSGISYKILPTSIFFKQP